MTIDLKTGDQYAPRRSDYCTKIAPVAPGGDCPLWRAFLARVTDDDADLQTYLARICGYWLTGHTHEHALFFLYGTGANGKSVFIETVAGYMGDYAMTAPVETFLSARGERHPTEIAALRGARLVIAHETGAGRHWNEALIKQLTGGDSVAARFMRQDFFTFRPTFKLCFVGNHKPSLRTVDEAIRRRIHLIPFAVTIPPEERDQHLSEKLKAEWGAFCDGPSRAASNGANGASPHPRPSRTQRTSTLRPRIRLRRGSRNAPSQRQSGHLRPPPISLAPGRPGPRKLASKP